MRRQTTMHLESMAKLIHPNGKITEVQPQNGKDFTLKELYKHLDCSMVERVLLANGQEMWIDEMGKYRKNPAVNAIATEYAHLSMWITKVDYIVGRALVCQQGEVL
jgi:hypothetical protein